MSDLFDPKENQAICARIERLTSDAKASWGKMDPAQALAHCVAPLELAIGMRKQKRSLVGYLFGKLAKKKFIGPLPFDRNLPTDASFRIRDRRDLATEKPRLLAAVERFLALGRAGITRDPHPFFGPMTPQEWSTLQWKHIDHHLRQFGA